MTVCSDYPNNLIYVIGGYNSDLGLLGSFEKFNIPARKWIISSDSEHAH